MIKMKEKLSIQDEVVSAYEYAKNWMGQGDLPNFIPELTHVNPNRLAVSVTDSEGNIYSAGNIKDRFTIQSISKAIALALAIEDNGLDEVLTHVDIEPCGDRFNSIYRLELMQKRPSNPFLNAGAIAVCSCIQGHDVEEKYERLHALAGKLLGNPKIEYSKTVCLCEIKTGHRNRALANMLLDNGICSGNPEEHLELYYRGCALLVTAQELSRFGAILACDGVDPCTGDEILPCSTCELIRALMAGCGLYDRTGFFNITVGIPAKSGSSGAIVGASKGRAGIGVFSPRIDGKGNSVCGIQAMKQLSHRLNLRSL